MTYLDLLQRLTSRVCGCSEDHAAQCWCKVFSHYGVLQAALCTAPERMVAEAERSKHKRTNLEVVAMNVLIGAGLDFWTMRQIAAAVVAGLSPAE